MKWRKIGKIFDPTEFNLPNNCKEFAQAPQVLVFENYVRVYFSTRSSDKNNLFLSHIAFVDFNKEFNKVLRLSEKCVIPLGSLGCYDEHGIFPLNVVRVENNILGYIGGINRRVSVSIDSSIGLAISNDNGETFHRIGNGPVLTSSIREPFLICDPFVSFHSGKYHMHYVFGLRWIKDDRFVSPDRVYKIGYAQSDNGFNWKKMGKQIISDVIDENECQALPSVIKIDDTFHMLFCFRNSSGFRNEKNKGYRIGYAHSIDMINWIRADDKLGLPISEDSWDSDMQCYPHVFEMDGKIFLLYNGNEFGKYGFGLAELEMQI